MESVNVVARFRGAESGIDDFGEWELTETSIKHTEKNHNFTFDAVLDPSRTQADLYEKAGHKMINNFMDGFNATIFAYGQSGSGKTFSMLGPEQVTEILVNQSTELTPEVESLFGIVPRATFHIFDIINEGKQKGIRYTIKVSYIEIYNESINDILSYPPAQNLKLREFPNQGMCVIGMQENIANTPEAVFECISAGTANKIVCSTGQNSRSSRSHTVFIITCEQILIDGSSKVSKINLVDLAGSEKLSKTGAQGQALKEAQKINLSLTTLGRCIKALTGKGAEHIPFRESKLTLILKESLGGNSKTTLIVTGSMRMVHQEETISTMQFAERAKMVKTAAKSNIKRSVEELEMMVEQMRKEIISLQEQLKMGGGTVFTDSTELQELKVKYLTLQTTSTKQIEELTDALDRSKNFGANSDYEENRHNLFAKLEESYENLKKLQFEKDTEKTVYEEFIQELSEKLEEKTNKCVEVENGLLENQKFVNHLKAEISARDEVLMQISQEKQEVLIEQNEYKEMIIELKVELEISEGKRVEAENELKETMGKLEEIMNAKAENDMLVDKFEYYTQSLLEKIEGLETVASQSNKKIEDFKEQVAKLQKENSLLQKQVSTNQNAAIADNSKELKELQIEISRLKSEINSKTETINVLQSSTSGSENKYLEKISDLCKELDQVKAEKAEILSALIEFKSEYDVFLSKNKHIYSEFDEREKLVTYLKERNETLENEIKEELQTKTRLEKSLKFHEDAREKFIKDTETNVRVKMQLNINAFAKQIAELQSNLLAREKEIKDLKNNGKEEYVKTKSELATCQNTIIQLNSQISVMVHEFEMKIDKLFQEKEALKLANSDKMNENLHLKLDISDKDSKIYKLNKRIEELEATPKTHKASLDEPVQKSPQKHGLFLMRRGGERLTQEMIKSLYSNIDKTPELTSEDLEEVKDEEEEDDD